MPETDPFMLDRKRSILSIVDIQEKLAAVMSERVAVTEATKKLIVASKRLGIPMLVTEQYPAGLGPTDPGLVEAMEDAYKPIEKLAFGCGGEPKYLDALAETGKAQVLLCGMETHVCVLQTCMQLLDNDYVVHVAADAVCSRRAEDKALAIQTMRQAGAVITTVETAAFQWLKFAGTPEFKDLIKLFK